MFDTRYRGTDTFPATVRGVTPSSLLTRETIPPMIIYCHPIRLCGVYWELEETSGQV